MNVLFIIIFVSLFLIGYISAFLFFLYIQKKQINGLMAAMKKDIENKTKDLLQNYAVYNQKTTEKRERNKLEYENKIEQINKNAMEKLNNIQNSGEISKANLIMKGRKIS